MKEEFFSSGSMRFLGGLFIVMALLAMGSYAALNFQKINYLNPYPATISVTGEGEVLVVPDIGQFSFAVQAEADTAAEAQELSGTKINTILAYLSEQGIAETDIKTQNYNLYPRYRFAERVCPPDGFYCPPGEQIADGFEVSQTISVKIRQTDTAAGIIAGVGEREATNISSLNFTVDDTDAIQAEARSKAISDAQQKAMVLAAELGVRIIELQSYSEDGGYYPQPMAYDRAMVSDVMEESAFGGAELPMGEDKTTSRVTVTYVVK